MIDLLTFSQLTYEEKVSILDACAYDDDPSTYTRRRDLLMFALRDADQDVRDNAAGFLARLEDPALIPYMTACKEVEEVSYIREAIDETIYELRLLCLDELTRLSQEMGEYDGSDGVTISAINNAIAKMGCDGDDV